MKNNFEALNSNTMLNEIKKNIIYIIIGMAQISIERTITRQACSIIDIY